MTTPNRNVKPNVAGEHGEVRREACYVEGNTRILVERVWDESTSIENLLTEYILSCFRRGAEAAVESESGDTSAVAVNAEEVRDGADLRP